MTIIFQFGQEFWIEYVEAVCTIQDAAGFYTSGAMNLEREGSYVGGIAGCRGFIDNDNSQAVGGWDLRDASGNTLTFEEVINHAHVRVHKQAGTAGNTNLTMTAIIFLKRGR